VQRLATIGLAIQKRFGGRPQDVEWLLRGDQVMIVQSRDYVRGR
jgi:phosphoenolpyruvate synthase/pyruvate phosphate dikinase